MMNILVTGARGATGSVLCSLIKIKYPEIMIFPTDIVHHSEAGYIQCDLTDCASVRNLLRKSQPCQIYHLAGSFTNNFDIDLASNVKATNNILQSILDLRLTTRILLVGSSAEYGIVEDKDNPIKESQPLNPVSIYGLTKVYQTKLMQYYFLTKDIDVVMVRPFNLIGKNISDYLFIGNLYRQIEKFKRGEICKITLGNLQNKRDYISIEDAVKDYLTVMGKGIAGEVYNIGSGSSEAIKNILEKILIENDLDMNIIEEVNFIENNKIDINDIYANIDKLALLKV
jgi:GDP-4-dehydro-6-deoxy-D-mannose reductase